MARATYSGIGITDLKGSIGGTTFQHNSAGKIVRKRPRIISRFSQKQNVKQIALNSLCRSWTLLSLIEQADWNIFAAAHTKDNYYAETKTLTGFNWYCSINSYIVLFGSAPLVTPPAWTPPPAVNSFSFVADGNGLFLIFDAAYNQTNEQLIVFTTPPVSATSTALRNKYIYTYMHTPKPVSTIDLTTSWNTAHGLVYPTNVDDWNFHISVMVFNMSIVTGLLSASVFKIDLLSSQLQGIGQMIIINNFVIS